MNIKAILSILGNKGYEDFTGTMNGTSTTFIFTKGKRPDTINIDWTEKDLFDVKMNIKKTVFNIDKSEHKGIDFNKLMMILRDL